MSQKSPGASAPACTSPAIPLSQINPLLNDEEYADPYPALAVLGFLSKTLCNLDAQDDIPFTFSESYGLSLIIQTCVIAIERDAEKKGRAE
jgi:hypothetical protein